MSNANVELKKEILDKLLNKHATFTSLVYERECKTKKSCESQIVKHTEVHSIRVGADYENLSSTKEGRAYGSLPETNVGLNGLEWKKFPYLLVNPKTGREFIRIELTKKTKFKSQFIENGLEVNKCDIEEMLLASEKRKGGNMPSVMNIPLDSIKEVC